MVSPHAARHVEHRHEGNAGDAERHHRGRVVMADRHDVGPRLVDAAVDHALGIEPHRGGATGSESRVNSKMSPASINAGERERDSR